MLRFEVSICKNVEFIFFGRRKIMDACLFVCCFFSFSRCPSRFDPVVLEYRERAYLNGNKTF